MLYEARGIRLARTGGNATEVKWRNEVRKIHTRGIKDDHILPRITRHIVKLTSQIHFL